MILARFPDLDSLRDAQARLAAEPGTTAQIYTPYQGSEEGPDAAQSWIPLAVLIAGVVGTAGFFLLQTYADVWAYPMNIGGRPNFSWPAYVPNAIEVGILIAIGTGMVCFLIASGLPRLYHPIDRFHSVREGSRTAFLLLIESSRPAQARALVEALRPIRVEEMA